MAKREKLSDEDIQAVCTQFLRSALGGPDTDVSSARVRNLIAYNAVAEGDFSPPEIADRSDFVATDVADTVEGMLPQLMKIFVSSDDAVEFEATKQGGEELAKTITGYINYLFYTKNDGLSVIYDWFKDSLIQKVGFVQIWAEKEKRDERQTFQGLSQDQLAMLMQSGHQIDGEPQADEQGGITVTMLDQQEVTCVKVAAISPHEMRIDPTARWGAEPAAIGRVYMRRKFELEEDGFDTTTIPINSFRGYAESIQELGETPDWSAQQIHDSHGLVECADIYAQLDRDGDGVAEWIQVRMVGSVIGVINGKPAIEKVDDHPFAYVCPIPRPHAFFGDCPADYAYAQQRLRTNIVRAQFDNLYLSVNQRTYVNTNASVNIDDLLESRPGGVVRGQGAMQDAIGVIVQPNMNAAAFEMNEWVERWGESRTGFNRYSKGTDAEALNKTATGVQILTAKADMRIELIARFMAQGVRQMFAKMLKLAVEHQDQQDWFNVNGSWEPVNPSEWKDRYNVKINVGLGHGTNEQKLARIMAMMPLIDLGLKVGACEPENVSNLIRTAATANEFKNPDEFASAKPKGPPVEQLQQQMQEMQQQLQQAQQQLQQAGQENAQLKQANASKEGELQLKAADLQLKHQIASKPEAMVEPDDQSIEWAKLEISRYDAETKRMALGLSAEQAAAQFALDQAQADQGGDGKARQLLDAAIELHKKHMNGTAPTTGPDGERSQMEMMQQMEAARSALSGEESGEQSGNGDMRAILDQHHAKLLQAVQARPRTTSIIRDADGNIVGAEHQ